MHRHFDDQMKELLQRLLLMGSLAETMVRASVEMLVSRSEEKRDELDRKEHEVNELQIEVDDRAIKLTALQQPVGTDVRFLFMASRIATELERIADQAINIAQNAHHVLAAPPLRPLVDLPIMAQIAEKMVHDSLDALSRRDCELARKVLEEEEKVDAFRDQIFRSLLTYMMSDPATIPRALPLILVSRNLERVGDHATNVAEEVIYLVQGRDVRHHHEQSTRYVPKLQG
jgi:phosphate transport system protein